MMNFETAKEVKPKVPNPLATGVTFGGLLPDLAAPRPKPRAGLASESSLLSPRAVPRTAQRAADREYDGPLVAGGLLSLSPT